MPDWTVKLYSKDNVLEKTLATLLFGKAKVTHELNGEESFVFDVDINHADFSSLALSKIVELTHTKQKLEYTDVNFVRKYRIRDIERKGSDLDFGVHIKALGLKFDLNEKIHQYRGALVDQTPASHIASILSGTGFTVGTITPTDIITVDYNFNTCLNDLLQIWERFKDSYDLVVNNDFSVDLRVFGNASSTSKIKSADGVDTDPSSLTEIFRRRNRPQANRIFALGGAGQEGVSFGLDKAKFRVFSYTNLGSTADVVVDSGKLAFSSLDWVGNVLFNDDFGSGNVINSVSLNDPFFNLTKFNVAVLPAPYNPDEYVYITQPGSNIKPTIFITDQQSINTHGNIDGSFIDESLEEIDNLLRPPGRSTLSGTYTAGVCQGWAKVGGSNVTLAENTNTNFVFNGTKSQIVTVAVQTTAPTAPTLAATAETALLNGTYTYKEAYEFPDGVGPASIASGALAVTNKSINVTFTGIPPAEATGRILYRKEAAGATYKRVGQAAISDVDFEDVLSDAMLGTDEPASTPAAAGGAGIVNSAAIITKIGKIYSCLVHLWIVDNGDATWGQVRVELDVGNKFPGDGMKEAAIATTTITADSRFMIAIQGLEAKTTNGFLRILSHKGKAKFYVDSVMFVEGIISNFDKFVPENTGKELWEKAWDKLQETRKEKTEINADALDLWPLDTVNGVFVGDVITLKDARLGINETVRILRKNFDMHVPSDIDINISVAPLTASEQQTNTFKRQKAMASNISRGMTSMNNAKAMAIARKPTIQIFST